MGDGLVVSLRKRTPIEMAAWAAERGIPLEWFDGHMVLKPEHIEDAVALYRKLTEGDH